MLSHIDDRLKEWSGWVTEKRQQRNELLHHTACAIQPTSRWFARVMTQRNLHSLGR